MVLVKKHIMVNCLMECLKINVNETEGKTI